jgi:hypothetical protein
MTTTSDIPGGDADVLELDELQPMAAAPADAGEPMRAAMPAGCIAPAFNPAADKEYYRFFFCGMIMLLGCLMPFGPEAGSAGYKSLGGAVYTLIALGMLWSWWGAIATNRFSGQNLKWVLLAVVPLLRELLGLMNAFEAPAVADFIAADQGPIAKTWGELFAAMPQALLASDADASRTVSNFFHNYGAGRIVVFFGALLAEVVFVLAIFSGAKEVQAQKKAKQAERSAARADGASGGGGDKGRGRRR